MSRALIFDYDGLICDTESAVFATWQTLYASYHQQLTMTDWLKAVGHVDNFDPRGHLDTLTGESLDWTTIDTQIQAENRRRVKKLPLLPGVKSLIEQGKSADYRIGIASNSTAPWVLSGLTHHGLSEAIEVVCTRADVENHKPAPDLYQQALDKLACSAHHSIAFEDSAPGITSAKAAGLLVIAVANPLTQHQDLSAADQVLASLDQFVLPTL